MAPFALVEILGKPLGYGIYLLIGVAFGAVLEMAGFANARRLADQFYLKNMTVLKVMFTGIVTAMVLVFASAALGLLDYQRVWVNPTYLMPGIVGGLIMGVGFILGGLCPGTSLVAVSNLKIDAVFFLLGASAGVVLFGETVGEFAGFYHLNSMGRFTIPEWLSLDPGPTVVLVVLMALGMFWGAEKLEARFGNPKETPPSGRLAKVGAGTLLAAALGVMFVGQPDAEERWNRVAPEQQVLLEQRQIFIQPGELIDLAQNRLVNLMLLDVRDEVEYNVFHFVESRRVTSVDLEDGLATLGLLAAPPATVTVLIANDERRSEEAWKTLIAAGVLNLYILEGGVNGWLDQFHPAEATSRQTVGTLRHSFPSALGARQDSADLERVSNDDVPWVRRVTLQTQRSAGGGCS